MNIRFPDSAASSSGADNQQKVRIQGNTSAQDEQTIRLSDPSSAAEVSLSSTSAQALKARLSDVPSIRQDRVQSLRTAIANGTYQPGSQEIAAAMEGDLFGVPTKTGS